VKVPEHCSVVGFDDVPLSSLAAPSLTTCGSRWSDGESRREHRYGRRECRPGETRLEYFRHKMNPDW